MNNKRNLYRILQVQPDAPEEIIRASYRTLMQKLRMHPDLGGDTNQATLLNQAYETLTNTQKRAAYDQQFKTSLRNQRNQAINKHTHIRQNPVSERLSTCPFCQVDQPRFNRNSDNRTCVSCHSPLQLSTKTNQSGQGKRRINRIPHNGKIKIITSWPHAETYQANIDDLSPNGLQLRCQFKLAPNKILKLFNTNFQAIGKVVRCQPDKTNGIYQIGIEFVTLRFENKTGSFLSAKI
ncbi:MAG: DnaJ domain-containing protein [Gammaproteobacteria bacterium]